MATYDITLRVRVADSDVDDLNHALLQGDGQSVVLEALTWSESIEFIEHEVID